MARKLSNNQKIIRVLIPSIIVICVTGYYMYPELPKEVAENAKFAYCRKCDKEFRHQIGTPLGDCLICKHSLEGLAESMKKGGPKPKNPFFPMFMVCYCEAIVTLGVLYYFTKPSDKLEIDPEDFLSMRCPNCKRKLRYRETQQGNLGQCPLCKKPLKFPVQGAGELASLPAASKS